MRKLVLALALTASTGVAYGDWSDALQWMNTNVTQPDSVLHPQYVSYPATNLTIAIDAASCAAGTAFPAFTAGGVPFTSPTYNRFGPTNCTNADSMHIDIGQFARQSDLLTLTGQLASLNTSLSGQLASLNTNLSGQIASVNSTLTGQITSLNSSVTGINAQLASLNAEFAAMRAQFARSLQLETRNSNAGIAQALAMAGTMDLQSDENYAVSMNVGTFRGQTAFAGGGAARLTQHVSLNAGVTAGVNGGPVGARAGIRFGW